MEQNDMIPGLVEAIQHYNIVIRLAEAFQHKGKQFFLVGGTVRDSLLGRLSHDIDATTDALPNQIKEIVAITGPLHSVPVGEKFGTIQAIYENNVVVEITTFRNDHYLSGSRHPIVTYTNYLYGDLQRRDFTINAIAQNIPHGNYIDPYYGRTDLKNKII